MDENDAKQTEPAPAEKPAQASAPALAPQPRRGPSWLALLALLVAAGLSALVWYDARQRIAATQEEFARRLSDVERTNRDASALARQAQDTVQAMQAKLAQIDARLKEANDREQALEQTYQELTRNRDQWQLAQVRQIIDVASQQLQLAGNVRAALAALQLADAQLVRADRPQFMPIRRALAQDIERLKSVQSADLPGIGAKLDALAGAVDGLPLALEERTARTGAEESPAPAVQQQGTLARLGADVWQELRSLVVVRRVDETEPPLIPPTQAYFLRENLKLRLLDARMSLLARDQAGYKSDLRAARDWIKRYFDPASQRVSAALSQIDELLEVRLEPEIPSISGSLDAVRKFEQ